MNRHRLDLNRGGWRTQEGFATLIMVLVILAGLTLVTFYAAHTSLLHQRISANEVRARQALGAAESGIDRAIAYLGENKRDLAEAWVTSGWWTPCNGTTSLPCGNGTENRFDTEYLYYQTGVGSTSIAALSCAELTGDGECANPSDASDDNAARRVYLVAKCEEDPTLPGTCASPSAPSLADDSLFGVVSRGWSDDGSGRAMVFQGVKLIDLIVSPPDSPLSVAGGGNISGSMEIVANPNGASTGWPVSIWSEDPLDFSGAGMTCQLEEYLATGSTTTVDGVILCDDCRCSAPTLEATGFLTDQNANGIDIVDDVGDDFPDLFEYLFGVPRDDWETVRDQASFLDDDGGTADVPNCGSLNENSSGLYWFTGGDCRITQDIIGSVSEPVLLVVENADLTTNGNATFFGLIYAFDADLEDANPIGAFSMNGTFRQYGALFADGTPNVSNGNFLIRYELKVLSNLGSIGGGKGTARMPGLWIDTY